MANFATIVRGDAYTFRARVRGASGSETLKLCIGDVGGEVGDLVKSLTYQSSLSTSSYKVFDCTLTSANTTALAANDSGQTYMAVVRRTDSGAEDTPILDGQFKVVEVPNAA